MVLRDASPPSACHNSGDSIDGGKGKGKQRLVSPSTDTVAHLMLPKVGMKMVKKRQKHARAQDGEKRVTRSRLEYEEGIKGGSGPNADAEGLPLYLPSNTLIVLTTSTSRANQIYCPEVAGGADGEAGTSVNPVQMITKTPTFRTLDVTIAFGRSRHAVNPEIDTSDAYYQRLHRYPEILEKRGARLELESLINERSKVILEIEEMRSRAYAYLPGQGGRGEIDRNRKLKESEERLQRYDALLPNQPRKVQVSSGSRANSPPTHRVTVPRPLPTHILPVVSAASSVSTAPVIKTIAEKPSKKLKITFSSSSNAAAGPSKPKLLNIVTKKQASPEGAIACPSSPFLSKYTYIEDDPPSTDDEAEYLSTLACRNLPSSISVFSHKRTQRLPNSFFHSETLRASTMRDSTKRRLSSRAADAFAFGHRLPAVLSDTKVFQLHGGVENEDEEESLEYLREARQGSLGDHSKRSRGRMYAVPTAASLKVGPWTSTTLYHPSFATQESKLKVKMGAVKEMD